MRLHFFHLIEAPQPGDDSFFDFDLFSPLSQNFYFIFAPHIHLIYEVNWI
jgi:hypothetical protein